MKNGTLLLDNYLGLINHLKEEDKLEIIIQLSKMLKAKKSKTKKTSASLFGALNDSESAEEWIARIRSSRNFSRHIEVL